MNECTAFRSKYQLVLKIKKDQKNHETQFPFIEN